MAYRPFSEILRSASIVALGKTSKSKSPDELRFEIRKLYRGEKGLKELRLRSEYPPRPMDLPRKIPVGKEFLIVMAKSDRNIEPYTYFSLYPGDSMEMRHLDLALALQGDASPAAHDIEKYISFAKASDSELLWLMTDLLEDERVGQDWRNEFVKKTLALPGPARGALFVGRTPQKWFTHATTLAWAQHFETHVDEQSAYPVLVFKTLADPAAVPYLLRKLEKIRIESDVNMLPYWFEAIEASDARVAGRVYKELLEGDVFPGSTGGTSQQAYNRVHERSKTLKAEGPSLELSPVLSAHELLAIQKSFAKQDIEQRTRSLARIALEANASEALDAWLVERFAKESDSNVRGAAMVARGLVLSRTTGKDVEKTLTSFVELFRANGYPKRHEIVRAVALWSAQQAGAAESLAKRCHAEGANKEVADFCERVRTEHKSRAVKAL